MFQLSLKIASYGVTFIFDSRRTTTDIYKLSVVVILLSCCVLVLLFIRSNRKATLYAWHSLKTQEERKTIEDRHRGRAQLRLLFFTIRSVSLQ